MTRGKTSDYKWVLETYRKNIQLHTGVDDKQEKLPIMHGKVCELELCHKCGVNVRCTKEEGKNLFSTALVSVERSICG